MKRLLAYLASAALLVTPWVFSHTESAQSSLALCRDAPGTFAPVAFHHSTGVVLQAGGTERHLACGGSGGGGGGGGGGGCKIGQGSCGPR
jgi:hypothetical protein